MTALTRTPVMSPGEVRATALSVIRGNPVGGYADDSPIAAEPTAWATIALAAAGEWDAARRGAEWLAERQANSGSVGVTEQDAEPGWPTSLAMLAWDAVDAQGYAERIERGARWALAQEPWTQPNNDVCGHDLTLEGWSWAPNTHSWLEPTAFFVLALRRAGFADHPRTRQAVAMIVDRLLPDGGANYGNTSVLGQVLLQHVQPSGIAALALAAEGVGDPRYEKTLDYLESSLAEPTGATSFAYAALGLAASGRRVSELDDAMTSALQSAVATGGVYKPALVALAADALASPGAAIAFAQGGRQ